MQEAINCRLRVTVLSTRLNDRKNLGNAARGAMAIKAGAKGTDLGLRNTQWCAV